MSIQQHEELIKSLYSKYSYITLWNVVEWKARYKYGHTTFTWLHLKRLQRDDTRPKNI